MRTIFIIFQLSLDISLYGILLFNLSFAEGIPFNLKLLLVVLSSFIFAQFFSHTYLIKHFVRIPQMLQNIFKHQTLFFTFNFVLLQFTGYEVEVMDIAQIHFIYLISIMILRVTQIKLLREFKFLDKSGINVMVYGDSNSEDISSIIKNYKSEFEIKNVHSFTPEIFDYDAFQTQCIDLNINEVIISEEIINNKELDFIEDFCLNNHIKLKLVPELSNVYGHNYNIDYIAFQPVLNYKEVPLDGVLNATLKRSFDLLFSGLVILLVLSWLTPIIGLLIYLESPGNIFFKQKRTGRKNQDFYCFKFRSMTANNKQADQKQATKNDARITKIGRFIRKTSIDELPQFLNVFIGDMSVVGPRPHMLRHTEEFSQIVDKYLARHYVRPGITGLAQIMGYRGETNTPHDIKGRVKLDLFYISNYNFFLDLKIILYTVLNAIRGEEKAY